jgi:DNA-directed RNA polymerase subunit M
MKFCPKCKSIMLPKPGKKLLECSCGYKEEGELKLSSAGVERKETVVVGAGAETDVRPIVDAKCPKCKHTKARHWELQTRSADEPATRFYKCENCGHTWREYK